MSEKYLHDIDSPSSVLTNVMICALPFVIIIMVPVLVSGIVETLNVSAQKAGFVASADMAGYTLGTLSSFVLLSRVNWRTFIAVALIIMVAANGLSALASDYMVLIISRFASGVGAGIVTAITFAAMGQMRDSDSAYAWWLVAQSVIAGLCFYAFPVILEGWGISGVFGLFSVLCMAALFFIGFIPPHAGTPEHQVQVLKTSALLKLAGFGMLALFLYECGLMGAYTYVELLGRAGGLSIEETSLSLSLSMLGGIAGGVFAAKLSTRFGRLPPILGGTTVLIISLLMLRQESTSFELYAVAVFLMFGVWNIVMPFLLGSLAAADETGRALALGNGSIGIALVLGPFFGALIIGNGNQALPVDAYFPVLSFGIILLIATCVAILPLLAKLKVIEGQVLATNS